METMSNTYFQLVSFKKYGSTSKLGMGRFKMVTCK